uniref:Uncharacterized protein n=1 Tax=Cucumis melo TaxID=3656 RepID=A0A9I9EKB4_CUCME
MGYKLSEPDGNGLKVECGFDNNKYSLSSKTPTSRTPLKVEAPLKIQAFFQDSNFKNITCFASLNQAQASSRERIRGSNSRDRTTSHQTNVDTISTKVQLHESNFSRNLV